MATGSSQCGLGRRVRLGCMADSSRSPLLGEVALLALVALVDRGLFLRGLVPRRWRRCRGTVTPVCGLPAGGTAEALTADRGEAGPADPAGVVITLSSRLGTRGRFRSRVVAGRRVLR